MSLNEQNVKHRTVTALELPQPHFVNFNSIAFCL